MTIHYKKMIAILLGLIYCHVLSACEQYSGSTSTHSDSSTINHLQVDQYNHQDHFIRSQDMSTYDMYTLDTFLNDQGSFQFLDYALTDGHVEYDAAPQIDDTALYMTLVLDEAEVLGSYTRLSDELILLDAGASIRWTIPVNLIPSHAQLTLSILSQVWRFEDALIRVTTPQHNEQYRVWGDGMIRVAPIRKLYAHWLDKLDDSYGASALPPLLELSGNQFTESIEVVAETGGLVIGALLIHGVDADTPTLNMPHDRELDTMEPIETVEFISCHMDPQVEDPCDDAARLNTIISTTDTPLDIVLVSPSYYASTPVYIQKSQISIKGTPNHEQKPIWHWSPRQNSGQSWPFIFRGDGPIGPAFNLLETIEEGKRMFRIEGHLDEQVEWLRLTAQDFGEVPPVCIDGRDVERVQRHQRQLFKVVNRVVSHFEITPENLPEDSVENMSAHSTETMVTLDRAVHISIPLSATPVFTAVHLLTDVAIKNIHVLADCPSVMNDSFRQANCNNPEVIDDGAVLSHYTDGMLFDSISAQGFGKFTLEIRDALLNQVVHCQMDHPSAYGSGGQGYGVHLIGASRTVVMNETVFHARHGVVVDFGSSDSQVLDSTFTDMNQALIDVHGEASRDTLIRGNNLSEAPIAVIVGGGGRLVHCNDGPRHHVIQNQIEQCGMGVLVSDYTEDTFVRSNTFDINSTHVAAAYGAQKIWVERNKLLQATIKPLSVGFEDTGLMKVIRNTFTDVCDVSQSFINVLGAEDPIFEDNLWCTQ